MRPHCVGWQHNVAVGFGLSISLPACRVTIRTVTRTAPCAISVHQSRLQAGGWWVRLSPSTGTPSSRHWGLPAERRNPHHLSLAAFLMHTWSKGETLGQKVQGMGLGGPSAAYHIPKPCQGDLARQHAICSRSCCSSSLNQTHPSCFFLGVTEAQHQQHSRHRWVPADACRLGAAVPTSCAPKQSTVSPALGHHIPSRGHRSLCPRCRASSAQSSG